AEVEDPAARVLREGVVVGLANHTLLLARDGKERPIADSGAPIHDQEGEITGVVLVFRDQTEERKYLEALRESEERLRLALSAADQGLYDLNVQTGEAKVNPEYAIMLGYDPAEFRETNDLWIERLHPDDREPVSTVYYDYIAGNIPEYRVEFRQRTRSGDWKWILSLGKVVEWDDQGRPRRMLGTHTDIDERKRGEEDLRKLSQAVEQSPAAVMITDPRGNIEYVNPKFTQVTGYTLEEARGQNPRFLKSGETSFEEYRELWETITSGREWHGVFHNKKKDGTLFWERVSISPIRDAAGSITHFIAVKEDITAQKVLEDQFRQAQKMESVGRLAGGVAHDFNNMLMVILGHAEMALDQVESTSPVHEDLQEILKAAQRSADLTRQLLAFARKQAVSPQVLDLNETVSGMLKMLRRLIGEDVELSWKPGLDLWPVKVDPAQVDQVLANLSVNARDAITGVGAVTIETDNVVLDEAYCQAHLGFKPGGYAMLAVSDTGAGMDKQVLERVFEPFFTTKELGKGTGLGLATVYGIVKQNNGFINVYSEPGRGTTFKIYFPRVRVTAEAPRPAAEEKPARGDETVLLVEDEEAILDLSAGVLTRRGWTVLPARTPGEALALAEKHEGPIHLLITDVVMPEMNGKELKEKISALYPGLKTLFMSGYTADIIAHHGVLEKGVPFLQKPFSVKKLTQKVREVLDS
ncbi:MAG: PAS domain S-box protein, partial [Thermodesulfobacteriota bacterium]